MKPDDAYKALLGDPEKFLKANKIMIAGYTKAGGLVKDKYHLTVDEQEVHKFWGADSPMQNSFKVPAAISVPMFENKDVKFDAIVPTVLDDKAPIMLTGQLTGCSFVMLRDGNKVLAAHVKPGGSYADGVKLQTELMNKGRFKDHGDKSCVVFGRREYGQGDQNHDDALVVGVRRNNKWEIFVQIRPGSRSKNPNAPIRVVNVLK